MRVGKKLRADAVLLCRCAADDPYPSLSIAADDLEGQLNRNALWLAKLVFNRVPWLGRHHEREDPEPRGRCVSTELLEAAQLLEEGWCPGDPVVLLRGGG